MKIMHFQLLKSFLSVFIKLNKGGIIKMAEEDNNNNNAANTADNYIPPPSRLGTLE